MEDILDNQEHANEDIILTLKDKKFYLLHQKFGLLVKGNDLSSAYRELVEKKKERISMMKELNIEIPVNRSKQDSFRHWVRIESEKLSGFFAKIVILAVVFVVVAAIVTPKLNVMMQARLSQLSAVAKRQINLPFHIVSHRVVPAVERRIRNVTPVLEKSLYEQAEIRPMEPERQEKIIKSLRVIVQRFKPFVDELRPLFKGEGARVP
jgi:hypothetical protein